MRSFTKGWADYKVDVGVHISNWSVEIQLLITNFFI
jgi:hypothetical protein